MMSKKLYALLLPVIAVAAMAMAAGAAQAAEPHWFICEHEVAGHEEFADSECDIAEAGGPWGWVELATGTEATATHVATFGRLTFTVGTLSIACYVSDRGVIWNEAGGGHGKVRRFENYECETTAGVCPTPVLESKGEPYPVAVKTGPVAEISGIKVQVFCGGVSQGTFEGTLSPQLGDGVATFNATTGELEEPTSKAKAKVTGSDFLDTTNGELVTAK